MLIKAFIVSHKTVHEDHGALTYTAFVVDVYVNGVKHIIEKRYSEFEELHKTLKKEMTVPYFPPKKVLNKSSKFIEERRTQLEAYLQQLLKSSEYTPALLIFLRIERDVVDMKTDDNSLEVNNGIQDTESQLTMCPFSKSSSSLDNSSNSREVSPDIILQGIYRAMYAS